MTWVRWSFYTFTRLCIKSPVRIDLDSFEGHFELSLLLVFSFTGHGPFSHLLDLMFYPKVKEKNKDLPSWTVIHVVHVIRFVLYIFKLILYQTYNATIGSLNAIEIYSTMFMYTGQNV